MDYQDLVDYKPKPVLLFEDEEAISILQNSLYHPILQILRGGYKTLKEIKEEYKKNSQKGSIPSDKSLYRHLKQLKEAGLIIEAGKRVYKNQTMTEKLFGRTATFFYLRESESMDTNLDVLIPQAEFLSELFKLILDIPKPNTDCMIKILQRIKSINRESYDILFKQYANKIVNILGDVSFDELQRVVDTFWIIKLLLEKSEFDKDFKNCFKTS